MKHIENKPLFTAIVCTIILHLIILLAAVGVFRREKEIQPTPRIAARLVEREPEPQPAPVPQPTPQPEPRPQPEPEPAPPPPPTPEPTPEPAPAPAPRPEPEPPPPPQREERRAPERPQPAPEITQPRTPERPQPRPPSPTVEPQVETQQEDMIDVAEDFPFDYYLVTMNNRFYSKWEELWNLSPPSEVIEAVVSIRISRNGAIDDIRIVESSNLRAFDELSERTIREVGQLPPLPAGYRENYLNVRVRFRFDPDRR